MRTNPGQCRQTCGDFADCERGATSVVFSISLLAVLLFSGAAMDYARATRAQAALQQDLDSAVLYAANQSNSNLSRNSNEDSEGNVERFIEEYMGAQSRAHQQLSNIRVTSSQQNGQNTFRATGLASTTLMRLAGFEGLEVTAIAGTSFDNTPVHVALVLDSTESMAGAKLSAMQQAASDLVDTAFEDPDARDRMHIAVVPFSDYINVGLNNRNASWIKDTADETVVQQIPGYWAQTGVGCRAGTERWVDQITGYNDGVPIITQVQMCDPNRYEDVWIAPYDVTTEKIWKGCVGPRPYPIELEDDSYTAEKVPGNNDPAVTCASPIAPLSNDPDQLKTVIQGFVPIGETYIPLGVTWGLRVLSDQEPFDQAAALRSSGGATPRRFMIVMSDGKNVVAQGDYWGPDNPEDSIWLGHRRPEDVERANNVTLAACQAAKDDGIEVITVGFGVDTDADRDLMQRCGGSYFEAANADELQDVFRRIAKSFSGLRLTQ